MWTHLGPPGHFFPLYEVFSPVHYIYAQHSKASYLCFCTLSILHLVVCSLSFFFSKLCVLSCNPKPNIWYQSRWALPHERRQHPLLHLLRLGPYLIGNVSASITLGEFKELGFPRILIWSHFGVCFYIASSAQAILSFSAKFLTGPISAKQVSTSLFWAVLYSTGWFCTVSPLYR